jgi:hypothetical protein
VILSETTPLANHLGIRAEHIGVREASARIASRPAIRRNLQCLSSLHVRGRAWVIAEDPRPLSTNIAIDFLRRAPAQALMTGCRLLSHDSDFAVGSIVVYPERDEKKWSATRLMPMRFLSQRRRTRRHPPLVAAL